MGLGINEVLNAFKSGQTTERIKNFTKNKVIHHNEILKETTYDLE
jgi:hypothetical protein